jgi:hypothetical protein
MQQQPLYARVHELEAAALQTSQSRSIEQRVWELDARVAKLETRPLRDLYRHWSQARARCGARLDLGLREHDAAGPPASKPGELPVDPLPGSTKTSLLLEAEPRVLKREEQLSSLADLAEDVFARPALHVDAGEARRLEQAQRALEELARTQREIHEQAALVLQRYALAVDAFNEATVAWHAGDPPGASSG